MKWIRRARHNKEIERWALFVLYAAQLLDCAVFIFSLGVLTSSFGARVSFSEWYEKLLEN